MWGAKVHQNRDEINHLARMLVTAEQQEKDGQQMIDDIIWPHVRKQVVSGCNPVFQIIFQIYTMVYIKFIDGT